MYQQDLLGLSTAAAMARSAEDEIDLYARGLVLGAGAERERIDELLKQHVEGWSLERLGILERSILRIATFELLMEPEVPEAVIIDQAVELAKRFCSDEAGALVNGVLGSLASARDAFGQTTDSDSEGHL
jgi:N utilization substance protein B